MTPAARAQAAIDLLDAIIAAARDEGAAADTLIARYFKDRRYAGSTDRRAVRDLVYRAIRRAGERPESGRAALIGLAQDDAKVAALFDGSRHGPAPIAPGEPVAAAGIAPAWLEARLRASLDPAELPHLLDRAPLDVRVNRLKASRAEVVPLMAGALPTPFAADGLRLPEGTQVEALAPWRDGLIEVQDEGSQLVAAAATVTPDMTVVDLCAGAGGKTLALAAAMDGRGRLIACDVDRRRLARLAPRAARARADRIETRLLDPDREPAALTDLADSADLVMVDAPCTGTGTWRRNPEARWRLTERRLARTVALQSRLLDVAAALVRPGGRLVAIVCSLLDEEGRGQAERFLSRHPQWAPLPPRLAAGTPHGLGVRLTPGHDGTDGFFVAVLQRPC